MNKAFEEILSRLEDLKLPFPDNCYCGTTNDLIEETRKVVQKVAEEYKKENYFNLDHVALHKCPKCGDNAQHRVNNRGSWACGCFDCRLFKSNYDHQKAIQEWEDYCKEYNNGWISCSEQMPPVETEVLILAKRKYKDGDSRYITTTAMYEDGTVLENDSCWYWENIDGAWDEENDCYIIPEGWWECRHYNPDDVYNNAVDDEVIAWQQLPEAYKEREAE